MLTARGKRPGSAVPRAGAESDRAPARRGAVLVILFVAAVLGAGCSSARKSKALPPPTPNEALYERARRLIEDRRFEQARKALTEIGTREVQDPTLDPLVKIAIADSYFYQSGLENLIEAQSRYSQFVSFYPLHDMAAYSQFQIGMCYFKQSPVAHLDQTFTRKAIEEFGKVEQTQSASRWSLAARQMHERCLDKLAQHDYQVGIFYFRRQAWNGAINRFKNVLEMYPAYGLNDAVYYHLGASLLKSGSDIEGRIYLEKLTRDFPMSPFADGARELLEKTKGSGAAGSRAEQPPRGSIEPRQTAGTKSWK